MQKINFKSLKDKYYSEDDNSKKLDIFTDEIELDKIKYIINTLPKFEQILFLYYVDTGSYTKTAKAFDIPKSTLRLEILKIKDKIIKKINNLKW